MLVRPTASTWLSPVWTPATSSSTSRSTTNQSPYTTLSPPPRAEVYLVENRFNPISTRAALELTDDSLRCTVKEYSKWVEEALGISDLRSRLQAGKAARVVGWCPWFIPLESWHWWRWWTAGTSTTNGGGLCLRPDPRVPQSTAAPAAPRLPLLGGFRTRYETPQPGVLRRGGSVEAGLVSPDTRQRLQASDRSRPIRRLSLTSLVL